MSYLAGKWVAPRQRDAYTRARRPRKGGRVRLSVNLKEIRGKRTVKEIAQASGVAEASIRQIGPLEDAYGVPITSWYGPRTLLALQEDEAA